MQILVVNDDGIDATGLDILSEVAAGFGDVLVIAPHVECSACSHAITLHAPLRLLPRGPSRFAATGTPTDCAYLGLHELSTEPVDLLLSGVNHGANLGSDVLYSGTVAAAMEAARYGVPALAFSLATRNTTPQLWDAVAEATGKVLRWFLEQVQPQQALPLGSLLNVNFPATLGRSESPLCLTHLGRVHYPPHVETREDPKGGNYYWIGGKGPQYGDEPGSDTRAIGEGKISITPLELELCDAPTLDILRQKASP